MPVILLKFLRPVLPYLVAAAAALGLIVYIASLRNNLVAATQKNILLTADNQADLAAITAYKAQQSRYESALATLDAQTLATNTSATRLSDTIAAAPASDDGPVAPVLARALDGLRALQGGAP